MRVGLAGGRPSVEARSCFPVGETVETLRHCETKYGILPHHKSNKYHNPDSTVTGLYSNFGWVEASVACWHHSNQNLEVAFVTCCDFLPDDFGGFVCLSGGTWNDIHKVHKHNIPDLVVFHQCGGSYSKACQIVGYHTLVGEVVLADRKIRRPLSAVWLKLSIRVIPLSRGKLSILSIWLLVISRLSI